MRAASPDAAPAAGGNEQGGQILMKRRGSLTGHRQYNSLVTTTDTTALLGGQESPSSYMFGNNVSPLLMDPSAMPNVCTRELFASDSEYACSTSPDLDAGHPMGQRWDSACSARERNVQQPLWLGHTRSPIGVYLR